MVLRIIPRLPPLTRVIRFRLVSFNIEAILREPTIYGRRERLGEMTDGLGLEHAYGATIERIKAQDEGKRRLGVATLMWVTHAERPLRADELCHALAIKLGCKNFNADNAPSISTLVSCCEGLITVDKETSAVRLIHPTVKEYLSTRLDIFSKPHAAIAEICLTYLNSEQVKALSADPNAVTHDKPFLEYCSVYWGIHAKRELSDQARSLALELLQKYDGHISAKLLLKKVEYLDRGGCVSSFGSGPGSDISFPFSGLHCASFFGITEVVATLMQMGCYTDRRDVRGSTPVVWAARNGHAEVVEIFLRRQAVHLDMSDYSGLTPLLYAVWGGHERVVEVLLRHSIVDYNMRDGSGKTPLSYAAEDGLEGVVKMLLKRPGISPDNQDFSGKTPLSLAARSGHIRVVETLLGRGGVKPDKPNLFGQTPLSDAASGGHEEVVKILLGRKSVNPDKPDCYGRTPLMRATSGGHEGVVKILLGREEVNPNKTDNHGQTPLMIASGLGFQEVIILLQSHEAKTPARSEG